MGANYYSLCRRVGLQAENFLQRQLSDLGITPAQAHLLSVILDDYPHGTTATELHKKLGITKSSLSSQIKLLRQKGYLYTENQLADDRVKVVLPTEKLWQIRDRLNEAEDRLQSVMSGTVTEEELIGLSRSLQELCGGGQQEIEGVDVK